MPTHICFMPGTAAAPHANGAAKRLVTLLHKADWVQIDHRIYDGILNQFRDAYRMEFRILKRSKNQVFGKSVYGVSPMRECRRIAALGLI